MLVDTLCQKPAFQQRDINVADTCKCDYVDCLTNAAVPASQSPYTSGHPDEEQPIHIQLVSLIVYFQLSPKTGTLVEYLYVFEQ